MKLEYRDISMTFEYQKEAEYFKVKSSNISSLFELLISSTHHHTYILYHTYTYWILQNINKYNNPYTLIMQFSM